MDRDLAEAIRHNLTVGEMQEISDYLGHGMHYAYKLVKGTLPETEKSRLVIETLCKAALKKGKPTVTALEHKINELNEILG